MKAPNCCPMCGESDGWKLIDTTKKGLTYNNAVVTWWLSFVGSTVTSSDVYG